LRTQRAPAVLLRRRAHGPPATASGCAPHGVSIKRPLALTRCSWSCRWWPAAPGWRASSPCAAPPAAPPPRSAAPPPAPVARPDGCLNDAPCPPFTSHGAPMRQPRRLNKAPATARSGVGHMCHHHACAAGRAQARMWRHICEDRKHGMGRVDRPCYHVRHERDQGDHGAHLAIANPVG
jgi:hypothetical protein